MNILLAYNRKYQRQYLKVCLKKKQKNKKTSPASYLSHLSNTVPGGASVQERRKRGIIGYSNTVFNFSENYRIQSIRRGSITL